MSVIAQRAQIWMRFRRAFSEAAFASLHGAAIKGYSAGAYYDHHLHP
jgi:hypothetical protein